jgi:hypothetical protein
VLPDGETKNVGGLGKTESVDGDIVRGLLDVDEREFLESFRLEDLS